MSGYVDIHAHVLPGIDDGPSDLEGALAMLRAAAESGTTTIASTPHLRSDYPDVHVDELAQRCQALREEIAREGIEISLVSGAEVSLVWALEASADKLKLATYDQRGTDLLIETPSLTVAGLDRLLYELRVKGLRVTLAHPERNPEFQRDPSRLEDLVRQGVLLQPTAAALIRAGRRSPSTRLAQHLCAEGLAHALASDGHRAASWRAVTSLGAAEDEVAAFVGPERARWMIHDAPAAILAGDVLPEPPPIAERRRKRWPFGRA
jgi:protein-tyrosine phosphatase